MYCIDSYRVTMTRRRASLCQGLACILAALAPCSKLYGFIGTRLAAATSSKAPHAYTKWIQTYSSLEYLALPDKLEQLLDTVGRQDEYGTLNAIRMP